MTDSLLDLLLDPVPSERRTAAAVALLTAHLTFPTDQQQSLDDLKVVGDEFTPAEALQGLCVTAGALLNKLAEASDGWTPAAILQHLALPDRPHEPGSDG